MKFKFCNVLKDAALAIGVVILHTTNGINLLLKQLITSCMHFADKGMLSMNTICYVTQQRILHSESNVEVHWIKNRSRYQKYLGDTTAAAKFNEYLKN